MSANLTLGYKLAEKAYRAARTPSEELRCLEMMLVELPKHKGTDGMQASLKSKISRLRKQVSADQNKKKPDRGGFRVARQGAGRAVIIGGPNAGKSQLLASLTNAMPEIGDYPFTTRQPQPGMMEWLDVSVQLIDTPPITADFFDVDVQDLVRDCELLLLLLDLGSDDGGSQLTDVVQQFENGKTRMAGQTRLDPENIGICQTQTLLVINKIDVPESGDRLEFFREQLPDLESIEISAIEADSLEPLKERIFQAMDVMRIYTKHPSAKQPDLSAPLALPTGSTVNDLAALIHQDLAGKLKSARIWGADVHDGTVVKPDYRLSDCDIVELHH